MVSENIFLIPGDAIRRLPRLFAMLASASGRGLRGLARSELFFDLVTPDDYIRQSGIRVRGAGLSRTGTSTRSQR
jgi:hypothetical protein